MIRRSGLCSTTRRGVPPWVDPGPPLTADELSERRRRFEQGLERHLRTQHRWGIVRGLSLAAEGEQLVLAPGLAVDGRGRRILVPHGLRVTPTAETAPGRYDAWLLSAESVDEGPTARGRTPHLRRAPHFVLGPAPDRPATIDPEDPTGWPAVDDLLDPSASGTIADEGSAPSWPIYLGRMERGPEGWRSLGGRRPTTSLAAARWLRLDGPELSIRPGPRGRRALEIGPADTAPIRDPAKACCRACRKEHHDRKWLRAWDLKGVALGNLVVEGDIELTGGPLLWTRAIPPPLRPGWRIYRPPADEDLAPESLRLELPQVDPEGQPARGWVIGRKIPGDKPEDEGVENLLRITPGGAVEIHGDLTVEGRFDLPPVVLDPADPRFVSRAIKAYYDGLTLGLLRADPTLNLEASLANPRPVAGGWRIDFAVENLGVLSLRVTLDLSIAGHGRKKRSRFAPTEVAPGDRLDDGLTIDFEPLDIRLEATGTAEGQSTQATAVWPQPIRGATP